MSTANPELSPAMNSSLMKEGPPLQVLMRRIAAAGSDVLIEPRIGAQGVVPVDAVVTDLFELLGLDVPAALDDFGVNKSVQDRRRLQITLLLTWLCADETLQTHEKNAALLLQILQQVPAELAKYTTFEQLVSDSDRREELARLTLARMHLLPLGETAAQAQDRLSVLSSAERERLVAASRAAEARARLLREAMARRAAEEAADKMGRE